MSQSETKQKLINSAKKLFAKKGYFNTKVSDIVKDAGVAQGTFYIYFKSKEEIFLYIVQEVVLKIEKIIQIYSKESLPLKTKILDFGKAIFILLSEYREVAEIYFFHLICTNQKFQNIYFEVEKKFKDFYLEVFKNIEEKEIIIDILLGFGKRLLEINMLKEKKDINDIIKEYEKGINLILGSVK